MDITSMTDKTELRGLCPSPVVQILDGLAMAEGLDRTAYVNRVLEAHAKEALHKASLLVRMARGNPLLADSAGSDGM